MRKANPDAVIDAFRERVTQSLNDWRAIDAAILAHTRVDSLRLRRRAASDSFLALIISWEAFFSAWVVAAVNREPTAAAVRLTDQISKYATEQLNVPDEVLSRTLLATSHLNLAAVRGILDKRGFNTAVRSHKELIEIAEQWLAGSYKTAALGVSSYQFCPALIGRLVRNVFAHESDAALAEASAAARRTSVPLPFRTTTGRNFDVRAWRTYILQVPPGETAPRVELFHTALNDLARQFRTT